MPNEVKTIFTADPSPLFRTVTDVEKRLAGGNFNNLGATVSFGKNLSDNFNLAGRAADNFKNKVQSLNDSLETAPQSFSPRPTISKYWENEAAEVKKSVDSINRTTESLNAPRGNPGLDSLKRISDVGSDSPKNSLAGPALDITGKVERELGEIEKKSQEVRKSFQTIAATRLDAGSATNLTKEIVRASERSRGLSADIVNIRKELANPNRKSSIGFLTDELRAAEREADSLNRKLDRVNAKAAGGQSGGTGGRGGANNLKLSSFQKTNLSYQANDVLTGLASGQNPAQILAQQGGQIAQIFSPAQITAFTAAYSGLVSVLGLGTIAIAATYKITGDLRAEAERSLKVEEQIQGAINKQILGQKESLQTLKEARSEAEYNRNFSRQLQSGSPDQLKQSRSTAEQLLNLNPPGSNAERFKQQILDIDAQLDALTQRGISQADLSFNQRAESFKKSQESIREAEEKRAEEQKKFREEVEKGIEKVKELGKQYNSAFDGLFGEINKDNPIAAVFAEGRRELESLKESLRGLAPELQASAFAMQEKLNANAIFSAKLDNKLGALDLRDEADSFRSFKTPAIKDAGKFFEDFIAAGLRQISSDTGGSNLRFNRLAGGGFSQSDARNDLLKVYERENTFGGFVSRNRTFADLTEREKDDFIRSSSDPDGNNLKFQQRLDRQVLAAQNSGALNDDQRRTVDRKLISLTQGIDPSRLTSSQRDVAAAAREREAERLDQNEAKAREQRDAQIALQTRIAVSNEKLIEIANKGGAEAVVRFVDDTKNGTVELPPAANPKDVQKAYDDAYTGGTFYEESRK